MKKNKKTIRLKFKTEVFERDNHTCHVCHTKKLPDLLNAHHITDRHNMLNGGYVKENGITVCEEVCHLKVEKYHITNGKEWYPGLHPDDLYAKINSSEHKARTADLNTLQLRIPVPKKRFGELNTFS